jgi:AcrR family transcriptional regulator
MGLKEKKQKHREEFRREIIEAARSLFSNEGYDRFSMRKLAAKIGYSPTTLYLYFRGRDDLLYAISEELFAGLIASFERCVKNASGPLDALRRALIAYVEFGLLHPEHYRVAFFTSPDIYGSPEEYLEKDTLSRRTYCMGRQLVGECIAAGQLRQMDADAVAQIVWTGVHGIVAACLFTADFPLHDPLFLAEAMIDALLKGLSP